MNNFREQLIYGRGYNVLCLWRVRFGRNYKFFFSATEDICRRAKELVKSFEDAKEIDLIKVWRCSNAKGLYHLVVSDPAIWNLKVKNDSRKLFKGNEQELMDIVRYYHNEHKVWDDRRSAAIFELRRGWYKIELM